MFAQAERLLDAARHGGDDATLDGMLEAFRLATERHSQREEQQMVRLRFPGFARHKQDHQEILAAFRTLRRDATGRPAARQNFFLRVHGQLVMRMLAHTATLDREFDRFAHGDRREEERP